MVRNDLAARCSPCALSSYEGPQEIPYQSLNLAGEFFSPQITCLRSEGKYLSQRL